MLHSFTCLPVNHLPLHPLCPCRFNCRLSLSHSSVSARRPFRSKLSCLPLHSLHSGSTVAAVVGIAGRVQYAVRLVFKLCGVGTVVNVRTSRQQPS